MPSSPLLGVQSTGNFGKMGAVLDTPHSAQEVFEFPKGLNESLSPLFPQQNAVVDTNTSSQDSQSWLPFSNSTSPQLDALHSQPPQGPSLFFDSGTPMVPTLTTTVTNCTSHLHPKNMTLPSASSLGLGGYSSDEYDGLKKETVDNGKQRRKKKAQVWVACTHCQKTCKKCSDSRYVLMFMPAVHAVLTKRDRPCERCDRYGLPDCVDTTRKPRKKGIKPGPYKRRASKSARNTGSDVYLPPIHSQPQSRFKFNSLQSFQHTCSQIPNMMSRLYGGEWDTVLPSRSAAKIYFNRSSIDVFTYANTECRIDRTALGGWSKGPSFRPITRQSRRYREEWRAEIQSDVSTHASGRVSYGAWDRWRSV
uniref:Zn(2)-C6 fungal-type domain-containing protein n=1 Tax=Cryptococcus bacillisporus CA1280 TaxID=1296109 RepID=A0A0D0VF87_CRYGA|nr:hypothetical protein I312_05716 [Cryptococcus bacillisporus CA1280]